MRQMCPPRHRCDLPDPFGLDGTVLACEVCGLWWRAVEPGNPAYATWRRATLRRLRARLSNSEDR